MKKREKTPVHLINLKGISGLKGISFDETEGIRIGALSTLGELERSNVVKQHLPMLWKTVQVMASPQIRTLGTIGGNLCSAVPSADSVPPLIALKASVKLLGAGSERSVLVEHFFKGPKESVLREDEILSEVLIPNLPELSGGTYLKLMRRNAMDIALVGVAVYMRLDGSRKTCKETRIAIGAVSPTPIRVPEAEEILSGRMIDEARAAEAARAASKRCHPISDIRSSKEYRRSMVEVLTKRAIMDAFQSIMSEDKEQSG
jgi:carbon-monoxide dehydrogenase medium subunit